MTSARFRRWDISSDTFGNCFLRKWRKSCCLCSWPPYIESPLLFYTLCQAVLTWGHLRAVFVVESYVDLALHSSFTILFSEPSGISSTFAIFPRNSRRISLHTLFDGFIDFPGTNWTVSSSNWIRWNCLLPLGIFPYVKNSFFQTTVLSPHKSF